MDKIILEMLTSDFAVVKKETWIEHDNKSVLVNIHKTTYYNSTTERELVNAKVPEPYRTAIMLVWGDTPTVSDGKE